MKSNISIFLILLFATSCLSSNIGGVEFLIGHPSREFTEIGPVSAESADPVWTDMGIETNRLRKNYEPVNSEMLKNVYVRYGKNVDAIINIRYKCVVQAKGRHRRYSYMAKGIAIRYIDGDKRYAPSAISNDSRVDRTPARLCKNGEAEHNVQFYILKNGRKHKQSTEKSRRFTKSLLGFTERFLLALQQNDRQQLESTIWRQLTIKTAIPADNYARFDKEGHLKVVRYDTSVYTKYKFHESISKRDRRLAPLFKKNENGYYHFSGFISMFCNCPFDCERANCSGREELVLVDNRWSRATYKLTFHQGCNPDWMEFKYIKQQGAWKLSELTFAAYSPGCGLECG